MKKIIVIALVTLVVLISNISLASDTQNNPMSTQKPSVNTAPTIHEEGSGNEGGNPPSPQQYGSISGSVSGQFGWAVIPLPFAVVRAGGSVVITGPFGNYNIQNLPLGTYTVTANALGYSSQSFTVTLTPGNAMASVSFILVPDGGSGDGGKFQADSFSSECAINTQGIV